MIYYSTSVLITASESKSGSIVGTELELKSEMTDENRTVQLRFSSTQQVIDSGHPKNYRGTESIMTGADRLWSRSTTSPK